MGNQTDQRAPADLTSEDYRQRLQAMYRLVEQYPPQAGSWVHPLLKDRELLVRSAAIVALGGVQDQDCFAALVDCFAALVDCFAAPTSHERSTAVLALVALGDERLRDPLLQA